ncbi:MAG: hypothetical protein U9O54_00560, partial [Chloroflexota bacterium]|nr:hypothetical protein [Chloroflexota bacterium]
MPENKHYLPNLDNVSILAAVILLAYTLTHFVSLPPWQIEIQVLGVYIPIILDFSTIIAILITGLTATGAAWLFHDHPHLEGDQIIVQHWLLPSLTALVLWLTIEQFPFGGQWWIAASLSGVILMLVLVAEYIVLAHDNPYYVPASIGVISISLSLFLILAIALHAAEVRLFFRVPALSFAAGLVLLRIIHLRTQGVWAFRQALLVFFLTGELAAGLHYWPLKSITFGIALLGLTYAVVELSENLLTSQPKTLFQTIL